MKALKIFLLIGTLAIIVYQNFDYHQIKKSLLTWSTSNSTSPEIVVNKVNPTTNNQSSSNQKKEYLDSSSVKKEKINKNSNDNCKKLKNKAFNILNNIYDDKQLDPDSKIKISKAKLLKLYKNKGCIEPSTIQQKAWSMEELYNLIENN